MKYLKPIYWKMNCSHVYLTQKIVTDIPAMLWVLYREAQTKLKPKVNARSNNSECPKKKKGHGGYKCE